MKLYRISDSIYVYHEDYLHDISTNILNDFKLLNCDEINFFCILLIGMFQFEKLTEFCISP